MARWTTLAEKDLHQRVEVVRRFNRFYTRQIGVLEDRLLISPYSLSEARLIYELAQHEQTTVTELRNELGLDAGYLSRMLNSLMKRGLIDRRPSEADGRQSLLSLTRPGQDAFARLNAASHEEIEAMLSPLPDKKQGVLIEAMQTIMTLLGATPESKVPYILRPPQPGDMGWVIQRHGLLYATEYGWDETFEALVAEIAARFVQNYDPKRERCWIAEQDGQNAGSAFLVKQSEEMAKLRLLLVEPRARGLGIGTRLVEECVRFSRQAGYQKITLWTNSVLLAARHIYIKAGFQLVHSEPHHSFGHDLISETWEMELS